MSPLRMHLALECPDDLRDKFTSSLTNYIWRIILLEPKIMDLEDPIYFAVCAEIKLP